MRDNDCIIAKSLVIRQLLLVPVKVQKYHIFNKSTHISKTSPSDFFLNRICYIWNIFVPRNKFDDD